MGGTIATKPGKSRRAPGLLGLLRAPEITSEEPGLQALLAALPEPAAAASVEGRVLAANEAWRTLFPRANRLPAGPALYPALASARRGGPAEANGRALGGVRQKPLL